MGRAIVALLLALPGAAWAGAWTFGQPMDVTRAQGPQVFHHLEAAGRKSVAVSGDQVAVVWEDNRDHRSRVYVAEKSLSATDFGSDRQVSGSQEAFEPGIVSLGRGRFVVAWEEGGTVWARLVTAGALGPALRVGGDQAAQAGLGYDPKDGLWMAWSQQRGKFAAIYAARLDLGNGLELAPGKAVPVDRETPLGDQSYPSIVPLPTGEVVVAWEDRRRGHTVIMYSHASATGQFAAPAQMNEVRRDARNPGAGPGTGAMRVALAAQGGAKVAAVWSDKRDFLSGYDVYAAFSTDGGSHFGANQKVQDSFGDNNPQWHPAIAADPAGNVTVVWDDNRDGTSDIWMAHPAKEGWSDNVNAPGASGPGVQSDPSIAIDGQGNLHLVWVDKAAVDGPTRLRYEMGRPDTAAASGN